MKEFRARIADKQQNYRGSGSIVIVAFGDSVTMGATAMNVVEHDAVYHARLKRMLETAYPGATFSVINSGIGGESAAGGLKRIERDVLRYQPDLVLVGFGLNDAAAQPARPDEFREIIGKIINRIRAQTPADVILLTPPFMCTRPSPQVPAGMETLGERFARIQLDGVLGQFAQALRDIAAEKGTGLADVYAEWERLAARGIDTTAMLANGLNHPSGDAHAIAAEQIMKTIRGEEEGK